MPKITKWNGAGDPPVTCEGNTCPDVAKEAEVTEWDGTSSGQSNKKPAKSKRKPVPPIPSPAPLTEQSSKQDQTDVLFAGTVDGPETDYLNL